MCAVRRAESRQVNPDRTLDVRPKLQALLAEEGELRALAQKAFVSYMRSVFLQPNKDVFSVDKLDQEGFAEVRPADPELALGHSRTLTHSVCAPCAVARPGVGAAHQVQRGRADAGGGAQAAQP